MHDGMDKCFETRTFGVGGIEERMYRGIEVVVDGVNGENTT